MPLDWSAASLVGETMDENTGSVGKQSLIVHCSKILGVVIWPI